ncbi:MAG TPA: cellulase family glycosylhydrolase [Gryllotalpicola sp.]
MKRQSAKIQRDGAAITWLGVNFWSSAGGPRMWSEYDPSAVRDDLLRMRELGLTITRSFCYWPDFMPTPDAVDEPALAHLADFLDQHRELGMTTIPTFIVGHMSGENWDPVWREGRDVYGDAWFVERQAWYLTQIAERFAQHPAVAGWLLSNEVPIYADQRGGFGTTDAATVTAWARTLIDALTTAGATQPISIGDGVWGREVSGRDNGFRVRDLAPLIDFHGPHVYRMETDPVRQNLAAAYICELLDIGGKPVIVEEFGLTSDYVSPENAAAYYRQVLHNTLLAGATGWLAWNNTDYDRLADRRPYSHHPFEMHFGITDATGAPKPQAGEMADFARLAAEIGFAGLERPDADVALVVSSYLESAYPFTEEADATNVLLTTQQAYIAAREADIPIGVAREADGLPDDCRLYLVPSTKQLTAPTWRRLRELAAGGATVYASAFVGDHLPQRGLWWPEVDETFGVHKLTRYGLLDLLEDELVTLTMQTDFGGLAAGETLSFRAGGSALSRSYLPVVPDGAEVLAVDGHGRPALLRNRVGEGWMVLGTYPVEWFAASRPEVNPEETWRLYDALATAAGTARPLRVHDPRVLAATLRHEDGREYAWLVSQSAEGVTVTPERADGTALDAIELAPYGVTVFAYEPAATDRDRALELS